MKTATVAPDEWPSDRLEQLAHYTYGKQDTMPVRKGAHY